MLVAAAGPASNLVMAVAASAVLAVMPVSPVVLGESNVTAPMAAFFRMAVQLNLLLAIFNMLPIPPLDGGNVLSGLLPVRYAHWFDEIRPYGFLLLYALILTPGYRYLVVEPYLFLRSLLP
jgi:Zn-dependent protease